MKESAMCWICRSHRETRNTQGHWHCVAWTQAVRMRGWYYVLGGFVSTYQTTRRHIPDDSNLHSCQSLTCLKRVKNSFEWRTMVLAAFKLLKRYIDRLSECTDSSVSLGSHLLAPGLEVARVARVYSLLHIRMYWTFHTRPHKCTLQLDIALHLFNH
jgi:hypothetical protein